MKNILILNCGTSKDILMSAHLITSLKDHDPNTSITVLTHQKNKEILSTVGQINESHFINSEFISETEKNDLYPDSYALNEFCENIQPVLTRQWDMVVNYSNDHMSAYLMKAVGSSDLAGTYISNEGVVKTTSKWATLQNYVLANSKVPAIATALVRNHILNIPMIATSKKININEDYLRVASQNFQKVREMKNGGNTKIIGINLEVGYSGCAINLSELTEIIETLEDSQSFKPVLLTSGKSYQKEIINNLNKSFDDKLISINVDPVALSAVVTNIDLLVSCANDQLCVADALEVKVVEIKGREISNRPSAIGVNNVVIYQEDEESIANDVILAINEEFESELPLSSLNTVNPTYLCIQDEYGVSYSQIRGNIDIQNELRYHIERSIFFQIMGLQKDDQLIEQIRSGMPKEEVEQFVETVKSEVTSTVKLLLASLRALKGATNSKSQLNTFIGYLGNLIQAGNQDTIVSNIVKMFEGNIENIDSKDVVENIQEIENHLFELKTNLQTLMNCMSEILDGPEKRQEKIKTAN